MRGFLRGARVALVATGPFVAACSSLGDAPVKVSIAPALVFPRDVLQNAASVELVVYDTKSGVTCSTATGQASGVTASTTKVASAPLTAGCPGGAGKFCGSLNITKSDAELVFAATALSSSSAILAYGCATAVMNQDALALSITMIRSVPPATCGDGIIQPTEQCDPPGAPGDAVCDARCHTIEETLSTGATSPQGPAFFLWPAETGQQFFGFFTDANAAGGGNADVALRVMSDSLAPVSTPAALASAIVAPNDTTTFPPQPAPGNQAEPAAALVLGTYFYVFTDNTPNGDPDIHMRSFDSSLAAQQPIGAPIGINGVTGAGEPNQQDFPAIAVNGTGSLFIAWRDLTGPNAGKVVGRTYAPTGQTLGTENPISSGSGNGNVVVAGTASGWLAVWDNGSQIKMRPISGNGTLNGPEIIVSNASHTGTQDHPAVAVLPDGRAAIAWADHGTAHGADIFVQRYDSNLVAHPNDQSVAINDVVTAGDQITPAIAGTTAANGSFIAAWIDSSSGQVRGRVLDGTTGFDFNPVDGTSSEFQVSTTQGPARANPTVAIGGGGPWAAIGWDVNGVVSARRFPTSTLTQ